MPQLDTSPWFVTIIAMILSLFIMFQLKIASFKFFPNPSAKSLTTKNSTNPWELKWTKIYLPLSLPLQ
uniref:ATP synthase complex subunit 8 n=1 Tax=Eozapus setchuanus TaxID=101673 RepID=A0A0H3UCC1_9RODE|nr:ATP synthase F0 subunit 8 [Eozapus setchuanus]AIG99658.1 ATP synthase F0 subunit 8 [Eozapus setchuanus]